MEYVLLIERLIAHPVVTNILLLMIMLSVWRVQDIITSVICYDTDRSPMEHAMRVQTNENAK